MLARNYPDNIINMNDALGDIYIFNAESEGLDSTFSANATFINGTTIELPDAEYFDDNDWLVLYTDDSHRASELWMPSL